MPFNVLVGNIVEMKTDAIVNAANSWLTRGGGVCGAIFESASDEGLQKECEALAPIKVGESVITESYNLKSKYIIHTVGPVWEGGGKNEADYLKSAYLSALNLAKEQKLESISFPLISAGIYGYPKDEAFNIASNTIKSFLENNELTVNLVLFSKTSIDRNKRLISLIDNYIEEQFSSQIQTDFYELNAERNFEATTKYHKRDLEDLFDNINETFSEMLFRLIDEKNLDEVDVYKKSNMDRKLFSKIRSNKNYHPNKKTILALSIGLKLNADECEDLLNKAGYSLSNNLRGDIIVKYFLENKIYDIFKLNEVLFDYNLTTL